MDSGIHIYKYILVYTVSPGGDTMDINEKEVLTMTTTAQKWGGSIGVRIPQKIAKKYGVVNGSQVQVLDDGEQIVIKPIKNEITLKQLLAQCEGDNPNPEFFSDSVGKEKI